MWWGRQCMGEWYVVSKYIEFTFFSKIAKVANGKANS